MGLSRSIDPQGEENGAPGLALWLLVLALAWSPVAQGAGLRQLADGWLLSSQEQRDIAGAGPQGHAPAPSAVWFGAGSCRLFGLAELPVRELAAGCRLLVAGHLVELGLRWELTGGDLYRESWCSGRLGVGGVLGVWLGRSDLDLEGLPVGRRWNWGIEGQGKLWQGNELCLRARFWWQLDQQPDRSGGDGRRRLALVSIVHRLWGVGLDLDRRSTGGPGLTLDVLWGLGSGVGLGLRADPLTGSNGPTLICKLASSLLLRTSHVAHPDLGVTHRFSLVWGEPGPASP